MNEIITLPKQISKSTISEQVKTLLAQVDEGNASEAELFILADALMKVAAEVKKKIAPKADYALGAEIEIGNAVRYEYKGISTYYDSLVSECKEIEKVAQMAAKLQQPTPQNFTTKDGELITINPALKKESNKFTVKYQK